MTSMGMLEIKYPLQYSLERPPHCLLLRQSAEGNI